ncbi:MAG: hypothetical protein IJX20_04420 [Alphaproteobacteria bacterium]|nr:hypothetical protein [Alphaproteobacteria bacterium]
MRTYLHILLLASLILLPCRTVQAFSIKDAATKIQDVVEEITEVAKWAEEKISAAETKLRDSKLGKMGTKAHQYYKDVNNFLITGRKLANLKVPTYMAGATTSVDGVYDIVSNRYIQTYSGKDDSETKKRQERHNMEIQHNLIADIYAKAYVLRNNLIEERKKGDIETTPTNTRELIEVGRAYNEKIVQRYVDILNLEAALLDFENTDVLMNADPKRLQLAKETKSE